MHQGITTLTAFIRRLNENFWVKISTMQSQMCCVGWNIIILLKKCKTLSLLCVSHTRRKNVHVQINLSTNYMEKQGTLSQSVSQWRCQLGGCPMMRFVIDVYSLHLGNLHITSMLIMVFWIKFNPLKSLQFISSLDKLTHLSSTAITSKTTLTNCIMNYLFASIVYYLQFTWTDYSSNRAIYGAYIWLCVLKSAQKFPVDKWNELN